MATSADAGSTEGADRFPPRAGTYRLGVFGSMMNPPHLGHLALVEAAHEQLGLDRVVVVPAGIPPHRRAPVVPARTRLALAIRAFADLDHVVVSDTEVERGEHGEVGYMVDTIEELRDLPAQLGYDELVVEPTLIVGADQAATLASWHRWERIAELARVAVVERPDHAAAVDAPPGTRWAAIRMESVPISSTIVREAVARGDREALRALVPAAIADTVWDEYRNI